MAATEPDAKQVVKLLGESNRNPAWLARQLKINKQSVYNWLEGDTVPRDPDVYDQMLRVLEPSAPYNEQVVGGPKIPVGYPKLRIPYAGEVPCSADWGDPLASEEFIEVEASMEHPQRFAAKVVGDSCYPALQQGDITIWHADFSPPYGLIVLAQRKGDHGCTVKQLVYDTDLNRNVLKPVNPAYDAPDDGQGWGAIARLVAVLRPDRVRRTWYLESGLRPSDMDS